MGIRDNQLTEEILGEPCFGFISAINEDKEPRLTRIFGFNNVTNSPEITFYTFEKDAKNNLGFLTEGCKIAGTLSDAKSAKAIQFKGVYVHSYIAKENEIDIIKGCNQGQNALLKMYGVTDEVFNSWSFLPSLAIVMKVDDTFEQTPKPNTGYKIN